jgi:hypothetical protein
MSSGISPLRMKHSAIILAEQSKKAPFAPPRIPPNDLSIGDKIVPLTNPAQIVPIRLIITKAMINTHTPVRTSEIKVDSILERINVRKMGISQKVATPARIHAIIDENSRINPRQNPTSKVIKTTPSKKTSTIFMGLFFTFLIV